MADQTEWRPAMRAIIAGWPGRPWDETTVVSFVQELQARDVDPDMALRGVRMHAGPFPPTAPEVEALARVARREMRTVITAIIYCGSCEEGWVVNQKTRTAEACACRFSALQMASPRPALDA